MAPAGHDSNDSLRKRFQIATLQQIDGDIDDTEGEPTEESPRGSQGADNLARPGGDNLVGGVNLTSDNSASCSNIFGQLDPSTSWISNHHKFVAKALVLGHPAQAAEGLKEMLGLQNLTVFGNLLKQSVDAIESEFHQHGDRNDKENLRYCLYGKALDKEFMPRKVKLDIRNGIYHGGKLEEGEFDMGHEGMSLDDFVDQDRSKLGKLGREHVLALRLYTTSSFSLFNEPLRDRQESHPLRMTVYYLDEALRKLRAVRASLETKSFTSETILWRGNVP
ncbi:hypothetical protein T484DRAFT_3465715 [Baffinella frigidus]|nr:hypothetical protein T484DRAFT_3465715 [Cryptophyta sp. CCMP2293]